MESEPMQGTSNLRHGELPIGYSLAANRSVSRINATTVNPTKAPISSVSTKNTCSSRSPKKEVHWAERAVHQFTLPDSLCPFAIVVALSTCILSWSRLFTSELLDASSN